jgi:macrolide transport system ATP-binding/permease protein
MRGMDGFQHDLIYGWRRLRRTPGFTLVAVLTLAFGIGANTALFSLVNGLLLKPIPVSNLQRLAALTRNPTSGGGFSVSENEYQSLFEDQLPAIEQVFVSNPIVGALSGAGQSDVVTGELVSGGYFGALGVVPRAGRLLQPSDDLAVDAGTPVVISERLWQRWFASDPSAIGQMVRMAGYPLTIIGVTPDAFRGTWLPTMLSADLWIPVTATLHVRTVQGLGPQPYSYRLAYLLGPAGS